MNDKQQHPEQRKQPLDQKPAVKAPSSDESRKPLEGPDFDVRHDKINPTAQANAGRDMDDKAPRELDDEESESRNAVKDCGTKACSTDKTKH